MEARQIEFTAVNPPGDICTCVESVIVQKQGLYANTIDAGAEKFACGRQWC